MKATNVEELIWVLETFEADQQLSIGERRGKQCIFVGSDRVAITIPTDLRQ